MDDTAVNSIRDLTLKTQGTVKVNDVDYWLQTMKPVEKPFHLPETLVFVTLTGLVAYVNNEPDRVDGEVATDRCPRIDARVAYLHVEDFDRVALLSAPVGPLNDRHRIAVAKSPVALDFPFGKFLPVEEMTIKLRTMFVKNPDIDEIVQALTKVDIENGVQQSDDGVSQSVQIKKGISGASVEGKTLKGLYSLAPRRTFDEAVQPESQFLFRLKIGEAGATAALFEAGGSAWRLASIQNVRTWLQGQLAGWKVLA